VSGAVPVWSRTINCDQRAAQKDGRRTASVLGSIICCTRLTSSFNSLAHTQRPWMDPVIPLLRVNRDPDQTLTLLASEDVVADQHRQRHDIEAHPARRYGGGMPKVSVYLPDELYREARMRQLPLSSLVQEAVERALRNSDRQEWVLRLRSRPRRHEGIIDTAVLQRSVRDEFGG
jgi:post-segregation antitoxin (ccd killing protein)